MMKKRRDSRLRSISGTPNASVEKVEEMWEMLDLPKESIVISDTETDENKALEQHSDKVLPNDELGLIKNNQMLTDSSINLAQDILGTQFKMKDRFQDTILGHRSLHVVFTRNISVFLNNLLIISEQIVKGKFERRKHKIFCQLCFIILHVKHT